jgi:hypothetical protein
MSPQIAARSTQTKEPFMSIPEYCQLGLALPRSWLDSLCLLHQSKTADLSSLAVSDIIASSETAMLVLVRGTSNGHPFILAACISQSQPRALHAWSRSSVLAPPTMSGYSDSVEAVDCLVITRPTHQVLRGTFDGARLDAVAGRLSIHLGGASLWFEERLKKGSVSGGDVDGVVFDTEQVEIWGVPE